MIKSLVWRFLWYTIRFPKVLTFLYPIVPLFAHSQMGTLLKCFQFVYFKTSFFAIVSCPQHQKQDRTEYTRATFSFLVTIFPLKHTHITHVSVPIHITVISDSRCCWIMRQHRAHTLRHLFFATVLNFALLSLV